MVVAIVVVVVMVVVVTAVVVVLVVHNLRNIKCKHTQTHQIHVRYKSNLHSLPFSGWRDRAMLLDELKQYFSYDTRLAVISFSTVLTSAEIWQCETNVPLYIHISTR